MNYRESTKFTPNLLMQHHEEPMFEGEHASPLCEVKNMTPSKNSQKKDRKNRSPKTFLSHSDN